MTDHETKGSGVENEPSGPQIYCTFRVWNNNTTEILIDLWSETIIQFALENSKTSKETRDVYSSQQATETPNKFPIVRYSPVNVDLPQVNLQNQELLERTFRKSTVDAR